MTEHTPDIPLGSWLAKLPDERLVRLLQLRPDLAQPPPSSIAALAGRAQARQSVKAATDELNFCSWRCLTRCWCCMPTPRQCRWANCSP